MRELSGRSPASSRRHPGAAGIGAGAGVLSRPAGTWVGHPVWPARGTGGSSPSARRRLLGAAGPGCIVLVMGVLLSAAAVQAQGARQRVAADARSAEFGRALETQVLDRTSLTVVNDTFRLDYGGYRGEHRVPLREVEAYTVADSSVTGFRCRRGSCIEMRAPTGVSRYAAVSWGFHRRVRDAGAPAGFRLEPDPTTLQQASAALRAMMGAPGGPATSAPPAPPSISRSTVEGLVALPPSAWQRLGMSEAYLSGASRNGATRIVWTRERSDRSYTVGGRTYDATYTQWRIDCAARRVSRRVQAWTHGGRFVADSAISNHDAPALAGSSWGRMVDALCQDFAGPAAGAADVFAATGMPRSGWTRLAGTEGHIAAARRTGDNRIVWLRDQIPPRETRQGTVDALYHQWRIDCRAGTAAMTRALGTLRDRVAIDSAVPAPVPTRAAAGTAGAAAVERLCAAPGAAPAPRGRAPDDRRDPD